METISISKLKAHLRGKLKKVQKGVTIVIPDHDHPVAELVPVSQKGSLFARTAESPFPYKPLNPLSDRDIAADMEEVRADRW